MTNLTPAQAEHVARCFPESREKMAQYLAGGAQVLIAPQNEVSEVGAYAVSVCSDPDFWIDCVSSVDEGQALVKRLGLRL